MLSCGPDVVATFTVCFANTDNASAPEACAASTSCLVILMGRICRDVAEGKTLKSEVAPSVGWTLGGSSSAHLDDGKPPARSGCDGRLARSTVDPEGFEPVEDKLP